MTLGVYLVPSLYLLFYVIYFDNAYTQLWIDIHVWGIVHVCIVFLLELFHRGKSLRVVSWIHHLCLVAISVRLLDFFPGEVYRRYILVQSFFVSFDSLKYIFIYFYHTKLCTLQTLIHMNYATQGFMAFNRLLLISHELYLWITTYASWPIDLFVITVSLSIIMKLSQVYDFYVFTILLKKLNKERSESMDVLNAQSSSQV